MRASSRRWFAFRLRTLFVVVAVVAACFAALATWRAVDRYPRVISCGEPGPAGLSLIPPDIELRVLQLAGTFRRQHSLGNEIPIDVRRGVQPGTYNVIYPRPPEQQRLNELLGSPYLIINPTTGTVQRGQLD
jgi:hypothetical protein